jgi:hypothetical protein
LAVLTSESTTAPNSASDASACPAAQGAQHEIAFMLHPRVLQPHSPLMRTMWAEVAGSIAANDTIARVSADTSASARAGSINATAIKNNGSRRTEPRMPTI